MHTKQHSPVVLEHDTAKFIKSLEKPDAKPIYKLTVEKARQVLIDAQSDHKELPACDVEEHHILTGPAGTISLTLVRPKNAQGPLPAVMYFHGGGWILGNFKTHERLVRQLAVQSQSLLVFVNYSASPEAAYPLPIEEAYSATKYVFEHCTEFNTEEQKLSVCGDSVGGNMAIAVTHMAKKRGGPAINRQILFYPVTDANFNNESYNQFADGPWLTKPAMEWFWNAYAPEPKTREHVLVSPLRASLAELKGLPPAVVITAENDVLRDEGESYARKLTEAGVEVTAIRFMATIHDFVMLDALAHTPAAAAATAAAAHALRSNR